MKELKEEHLHVMKLADGGCTVFGYMEAYLLREVQQFNEDFIKIVDIEKLEEITGEKYDPKGQLPYFGAVLTQKGKEYLHVVTEIKKNLHAMKNQNLNNERFAKLSEENMVLFGRRDELEHSQA